MGTSSVVSGDTVAAERLSVMTCLELALTAQLICVSGEGVIDENNISARFFCGALHEPRAVSFVDRTCRRPGRARSKTDTAFRISCERPEITLNKLDQVSQQHFKDFAAFKLLPAPCDVQRQLCPSFDYSSHLNIPFNIMLVVERRRPPQVGR